jgi:glycogen operon protein
VNFSVFSRHATGVELLLFDHADDAKVAGVIRIDPITNRTYHYWHVFVPGLTAGQIYGYRVEGRSDPTNGLRFDPTKVLLDPYGRGVLVPERYCRSDASRAGDNSATAMKSVVVDPVRLACSAGAPASRQGRPRRSRVSDRRAAAILPHRPASCEHGNALSGCGGDG